MRQPFYAEASAGDSAARRAEATQRKRMAAAASEPLMRLYDSMPACEFMPNTICAEELRERRRRCQRQRLRAAAAHAERPDTPPVYGSSISIISISAPTGVLHFDVLRFSPRFHACFATN